MLRIAITPEHISPIEHRMIAMILDAGWDYVHLRHPSASITDMRRLIQDIPQRYYRRLRLHGHFELLNEFNLGGIHLNHRCPNAPALYRGAMSRSCHSIDELSQYPECDYLTLSPIFDSISKQGYQAAFSESQLQTLPANRVIALGGITPERIAQIMRYPFAGYAVLGYLFGVDSLDELQNRLTEFKNITI